MDSGNPIRIDDKELREAASKGNEAFLSLFTTAIKQTIGDEMTTAAMQQLNAYQHTLLGYWIFREQVMEGGFCQLIQNGYGPYIFDNPFAKSLRVMFGMLDLSKLVYKAKEIYDANRTDLERERTDEEFMAMYEQYEAFDTLQDSFIDNEENYTSAVAHFVDAHIDDFATVAQ